MWNRRELKQKGKAAFLLNYWPCVIVAFILTLLTGGSGVYASRKVNTGDIQQLASIRVTPEQAMAIVIGILVAMVTVIVIAVLLDIFVFNPLIVGGYRFFVRNSEEQNPPIRTILSAFRDGNFGRVFVTMLLADLFTFLWSLLFIIPGIVKLYSYRMVPYLLADHPEMSATEIITKSREMMNGHKWNAFVLDLSFILWHILTALTMGIVGILYVMPYVQATNAELYKALSR